MKKYFFSFLITFFFSLSLFAKTIVLGTTEWPPYIQNENNKGYAYEIVYAAFKQAGYDDIKIIFMPWDDAEKAVSDGNLDAIFPEYFSEKQKQNIIYTDSFSDSPVGFYKKMNSGIHFPNTHPEKNLKATLNKMQKYRFGVVKGYVNLASFDNNTALKKYYVDSDLDNLKQLYSGKVDIIFIDKNTAEYLLHHELSPEYQEQLVFMTPPLYYKKLYVGLSNKNPKAEKISADFNKGLQEIKKNGIFAEIIDRDAVGEDEHIA